MQNLRLILPVAIIISLLSITPTLACDTSCVKTEQLSWLIHCRDKDQATRYRICEDYILSTLDEGAPAVIFLRSRISKYINNTEHNARRNLHFYVWFINGITIVGGVGLIWVTWKNKTAPVPWSKMIFTGIGLMLFYAGAFNWHLQYRAEFILNTDLKTLRDRIETRLVHIGNKEINNLSDEEINNWLAEYQKIMENFSEAYTSSFKIPDFSQISKLTSSPPN